MSAQKFRSVKMTMTARTDDYDAIVRVVQLYVDAFNDNNVSKLKEAFDKDAWIFYIDADGVLHKNLISPAQPAAGVEQAPADCAGRDPSLGPVPGIPFGCRSSPKTGSLFHADRQARCRTGWLGSCG